MDRGQLDQGEMFLSLQFFCQGFNFIFLIQEVHSATCRQGQPQAGDGRVKRDGGIDRCAVAGT